MRQIEKRKGAEKKPYRPFRIKGGGKNQQRLGGKGEALVMLKKTALAF